MSVISVIAACIIIVAVIFTITCIVFYVNREDVSRCIIHHIEELRLRYITPRAKSTRVSPNIQASRKTEKIDTHHHMIPPVFLNHIKQQPKPPGGMSFPSWSPQISLDFMARNGISTSILSFAHTVLDDTLLCQKINIYAHKLRLQYPTKFGFFATVPSITENSLHEVLSCVKFCYEKLNPEGVTLFTSYNGKYLGDELFRPIWEELNRRNAVVFIHPIANSLCPPPPISSSSIPPMIDCAHEITRTACSLIYCNTLSSCPNIKIILSYAGGTLPYISIRVANSTYDARLGAKTPEEFMRQAKRFYMDLAASSYSESIEGIEKWWGPGHTTYGSDFPFIGDKSTVQDLRFLDAWMHQSGDEGKAVMRETTLDLFPRLKNQIEQARAAKMETLIRSVDGVNGGDDILGEQNV